MNLHKIVKIVIGILGVLGVVFLGGILTSEDGTPWITPLISLAYVVLAICIALVLIYVLINLLASPAKLKQTLIAVGLFLAVIVMAYLLADDSAVNTNSGLVEGSTSKWVGTGLYAFYFLGIIALGTMAWTEIKNFIKE